MRIHPFKCLYPDLSLIKSVDFFFQSVKDRFPEYRDSGFYLQDQEEGLFIYKIKDIHGEYVGLIAANDLVDLQEGRIKKHERTLATKEQVMMEFTLQRRASIKPVLLGFDMETSLRSLFQEVMQNAPFLDLHFKESEEVHQVWKITSREQIHMIQEIFSAHVKSAYIADGHHRCTTAEIITNNNRNQGVSLSNQHLLVLYFPFSHLKIYDYNRVVDFTEWVHPSYLMAELHKKLEIEVLTEGVKPKNKFHLTFYLEGHWYLAKWKEEILEKYTSDTVLLDTRLFNREILEGILGIGDVEKCRKIQYVSGTDGVVGIEKLVDKADQLSAGFVLYPVSIEELKAVADASKSLPAKSTWFEPRVKNGIIAMKL